MAMGSTDKTPTTMEQPKAQVPALVKLTPEAVQLKINTEVTKSKLSLPDLEKRALNLVKNEDHVKEMQAILDDLKKVDDLAESVHKLTKKPYLDGGRACDAGKTLVLTETQRIRGMFQADYTRLLKAINDRTVAAAAKKVKDEAILKGIDDNLMLFSNKVIAAITKKELLIVEAQINLEKSPSRAAKYGEFHARAVERFDSVLLPIIRDQKTKLEEMAKLNGEIQAAEDANDPDKMDELIARQDEISNQVLQNHALVQDKLLNQEAFPVIHAEEVLPGVKTKRTNYTYEIADLDVALKKSRDLLEFTIDKTKAKLVKDKLVDDGHFKDKDEVIVDGIRYIANKTMEAL
jgi:hypothetical protein